MPRPRPAETFAAGQAIFNSHPLTITNVGGLNDNPALGKPAAIMSICATCGDTPNVGNHSLPLPLDIGTGMIRRTNPTRSLRAVLPCSACPTCRCSRLPAARIRLPRRVLLPSRFIQPTPARDYVRKQQLIAFFELPVVSNGKGQS